MPSTFHKKPIILLAFANDADNPLRELAREQDQLRDIFEKAEEEDRCKIVSRAATTPKNIIDAFQKYRDQIKVFHYAGHSGEDEIFLKGAYQDNNAVEATDLADFLALQKGLELVFLNSCLSLNQAKAYHDAGVSTVIATDNKIGDSAAREFARLFYNGIVTGGSIKQSYQEAVAGTSILKKEGIWDTNRNLHFLENEKNSFPWQIYPASPPTDQVRSWVLRRAVRLTPIPRIDLDKEFIGRDEDLKRLIKELDTTSNVVLVNGLGGIGKTVLATAYVNVLGNEYDHLVWINRGEELITSFADNDDLAFNLKIPYQKEESQEDRFRKILLHLRNLNGNNLLVIDNAQEQLAKKEIFEKLPGPPNWKVLSTSRKRLPGFNHFSLDVLDPKDAHTLFKSHSQGEYIKKEVENLLKEIGYHTLTIELLAKLLNKKNKLISISELTNILKSKKLNDNKLQTKVSTNHNKEEQSTYLHLLKAFKLTDLEEEEKSLLKQFVVLPIERYEVRKLAEILGEEDHFLNEQLNSLSKKGWLSEHEDQTFSVHRLIRQVLEYQLEPKFDDIKSLLDSMIDKMRPDAHESFVTKNKPWLEYAVAVEAFIEDVIHKDVAILQDYLGRINRSMGRYQEALEYHKKGILIAGQVLGSKDPDLAVSYNEIGLLYSDMGGHEEALTYYGKSIAIFEEVLGAKHSFLATSYNNIGNLYLDMGGHEEALTYYEKSIAIREEVLGAKHPELATSYNNIGNLYRAMGGHEEALTYYEKSIAIREEVLGAKHPSLATSYSNIGVLYRAMGGYEEALTYYEKSIAIREEVLGAKHPDLAMSYNNIGVLYRAMGRHEEALTYYEKSIAIFEEVLGAKHPSLATSYNNISYTYEDLGQHEKAEMYKKMAEEIKEYRRNNPS